MDKTSDLLDNEDFNFNYEEADCVDCYDEETDEQQDSIEEEDSETIEENEEEKKDDQQKQDNSSEHDGKYFVIQKGMACCDKGAKFPQFKVTSQQKHYWNDEKGQSDYLAVTEDDLTFNPTTMPFGTCSVKNGNPCSFVPSGKWTKTYDKVKILDKKCVTEISELLCAVGGKITIMKHGQQTEAGKRNVNNASSAEQQIYNPMIDFEEFKDEINESDQLYYK